MRLPDWLDRDVITFIIGAVLATLLVPFLARRWASKQKELEVKTELVSDVAETMMALITVVTDARVSVLGTSRAASSITTRGGTQSRVAGYANPARPTPGQSGRQPKIWRRLRPLQRRPWRPLADANPAVNDVAEQVNNATSKFRVERQVIGTRLEAYFGWSGIPENWDRLCDCAELLATSFQEFERGDHAPRELRRLALHVDRLWATLGLSETSLQEAENQVPLELEDREWRLARLRLLYCKAEMVRRILRKPMPVFAWGLSGARRQYRRDERKRSAASPRSTGA